MYNSVSSNLMALTFSDSCNVNSVVRCSDYLTITDSKIRDFYLSNPQISFNDVNLLFLDIIENITKKQILPTPFQIESAILNPEKKTSTG